MMKGASTLERREPLEDLTLPIRTEELSQAMRSFVSRAGRELRSELLPFAHGMICDQVECLGPRFFLMEAS